MPRGFFATLPKVRKEGKQTQPVSFFEKAGLFPAQAPMTLHMAEFAPEYKGHHAAVQQNRPQAALALGCRRHYHEYRWSGR
jgi:hypothetical protein